MKYVVKLQPHPSKEELEWAWKFTIFTRANGRCEHCHKITRLDACHIKPRDKYPNLAYEPSNGIALCRTCHMRFDHKNHHRPSGRPIGTHLLDSTKQLIGQKQKEYRKTKSLDYFRLKALSEWDKRGRKHTRIICEHCGKPLKPRQRHAGRRFCSPTCHYQFRTGKRRKGY